MKKTPICLLCLFLAIGVKVQGMTFYSTLNPNSTEGNYYGALYFSFSSTDNWYGHDASDQEYTDPITGTQISIESDAGLAQGPNELNLLVEMGVSDPYIGAVQSSLSGYPGNTFYGYNESGSGAVLNAGQPTAISYGGSGSGAYYSYSLNATGTVSFGYSLTGYFDGTAGSTTGSWFFDYTVPPVVSVPEPAMTLPLALGACGLWLARARQRRRN
jgi:hypothetical protein